MLLLSSTPRFSGVQNHPEGINCFNSFPADAPSPTNSILEIRGNS
jgi:hypothetical protein